jgi:hypothetical protein
MPAMLTVKFTRKQARSRLSCHRADGSSTAGDLGPQLPYHDLAHYVVESTLGIRRGFFGNIAAGCSIESLGDKRTIKTLGAEAWVAEVLARALISVQTGACHREQFAELVNSELAHLKIAAVEGLSVAGIDQMSDEFQRLAKQFDALAPGESLSLEFRSSGP